MSAKRYREKFTFWLNLVKDDEFAIAEQIGELKTNRTFAKTIRDGIRLICDLRAGQLEVLFVLFPWVKAEFLAGVQPKETAGEKVLREQLERMEKLLIEQGNQPIAIPQLPAPSGLKKIALTPADDEDLLVVKKASGNGDAAQNFLNSLAALTG